MAQERICWEIEYAWTNGNSDWCMMHVFTNVDEPDPETYVRNEIARSLGARADQQRDMYIVRSIKRLG